jgi:hypothetical protein
MLARKYYYFCSENILPFRTDVIHWTDKPITPIMAEGRLTDDGGLDDNAGRIDDEDDTLGVVTRRQGRALTGGKKGFSHGW